MEEKLYKAVLSLIIAVTIILVIVLSLCIDYIRITKVPVEAAEPVILELEKTNETKSEAQEIMNILVRYTVTENHPQDSILYEDAQMLMKLAMAEAEQDGIAGKAMVMRVVLNRVKDNRFPNSVKEVIYQSGQFSPIADGRYDKAEADVECHLALAEIEKGTYDNVEALYFENCKNSWQSKKCEYLYTIGHHRFYK